MSKLHELVASEHRVRVQAGVQAGGWRFDSEAIREACRALRITRPVNVSIRASGRWAGMWSWDAERGEHTITVLERLPAWDASHTLYHELAHAHQHEHWPKEQREVHGSLTQRRRMSASAYSAQPLEVHADAVADEGMRGRHLCI